MKISIIMCVFNSMPYIASSIESFRKQKYKNKELIIVYSKSKDNTEDYLKTINDKNIKKFNFNGSIYKSLNFGIEKSKGEIIGVLHSDDIFFSEFVLSHVVKECKKSKTDVIFGNILFSEKNDLTKITRSWTKIDIKKKYNIPPHTGTFIKKKIYSRFKYDKKYTISADTDLLIRLFNNKVKYKYLNEYISIMRTGGLSTNIYFLKKKIEEDLHVFKNNQLSFDDYIKKIIYKTGQLFFLKKIKITKYHRVINNFSKVKFLEIKKFHKILGKVISALNLAFITYNYKFNLRTHNYLFWPDGIFSKRVGNIKKMPGRIYFKKILKILNSQKKK